MTYRFSQIDTPDDNPFKEDKLKRRESVEFVANLIERAGKRGPFVLALDAPYGTGKSTFIGMLRAVLSGRNVYSVQFNAWQVDHTEDPLVPLVAVLDKAIRSDIRAESKLVERFHKVRRTTAMLVKHSVVGAAKFATAGVPDLNKGAEAIATALSGEIAGDVVDQFQKEQELAERFRTELARAVAELPNVDKEPTLVFVIDELDRCRPDFAISLLERIKHMFDIEKVVFVLAVDKPQLEAATAAVYGERINAAEYLRKFIDMEFGLPRPSNNLFVHASIKKLGMDKLFAEMGRDGVILQGRFITFFTAIADALELSLRTQERCLTRAKIVLEQSPRQDEFSPVLVALLVVLRATNQQLFSALVQQRVDVEEVLRFFHADKDGQIPVGERVVIEASLAAEIRDHATRDWWSKRYEAVAADDKALPEQKHYAGRYNQILGSLLERMEMPGTYLASVAHKVDMAAAIRD